MCHVCRRLNIDIEEASEEQIEQYQREDAYIDRSYEEFNTAYDAVIKAQGIPVGTAPRHQIRSSPPRKVVVQPTPSHDGAPTFAAWFPTRPSYQDPDWAGDASLKPEAEQVKLRPQFGMRVYDASHDATAERAALLARRIAELTYEHQMESDRRGHKDRIEVVALPLPASLSDEERAMECAAHNKAEQATRLCIADAAVAASWYLMAEDVAGSGGGLQKKIWVIHDLKDSWEEALRKADGMEWNESRTLTVDIDQRGAHGHFLTVSYDVADNFYDGDEEHENGEPRPEFFVQEHCLERLGHEFYDFRDANVRTFYDHFVFRGVMGVELVLARAVAAGAVLPRRVVIEYEDPDWRMEWRDGKLVHAPWPSRWLDERYLGVWSKELLMPRQPSRKRQRLS